MSTRRLGVGLFLLPTFLAAASGEDPYRLTAVVVRPDALPMALVELPGQQYQRLHVGDAFYDGTVIEITPELVRVRFPEGEAILRLKSRAHEEMPAGESAGEPVAVEAQRLRPALERALVPLVRQKTWESQVQMQQIADLFTRLLGLAEGVRVLHIDGVTAESEDSPARQLAEILAEGLVIGVTIEGDPERDRVYLMPEDEMKGGVSDSGG